ncbi:MAG: acyl-CoA dehydrogenase family protein [Myxococcota bacterium]|nr:acyl-CoA dehydrogenase family protein [Myxococcota bacterium]
MDLNDTPEEASFRAEARAFLEQHLELLPPGTLRRGLAENLTAEAVAEAQAWQKTKADGGWACINWPEEYGGRGASPIQKLIWGQEEAQYEHPNTTVFSIGTGMAGPTILAHGTDEQKAEWIPKLVTGEEIWCQLFSEPSAGSDLAGLRTSAVRDGDEWVLNGQKIWTSGANWCKWGVIVTRSDPNAAKHAGLTYFVVDMSDPGIEIRPITQINGGQGFNEVFFTDVRIPDAWRLDEVGNGWRVAITTLMNERVSIGSAGGESMISSLIEHVQELKINGGRALDDPAVRQRVADFYVRSKGVEFTGHRTVTKLSQGGIPGPEASLGKLIAGALIQDIASYAMDLEGQAGSIMADSGFQASYLGSPGLRIAGGTDEVLRNIIAERVLGLPPETRMDKDIAFKNIPTGPPSK